MQPIREWDEKKKYHAAAGVATGEAAVIAALLPATLAAHTAAAGAPSKRGYTEYQLRLSIGNVLPYAKYEGKTVSWLVDGTYYTSEDEAIKALVTSSGIKGEIIVEPIPRSWTGARPPAIVHVRVPE